MKKIEKLTEAQEGRMREVLQEWLDNGRSTHACDRPEAEKAITAMYEKIGKPKPIFFWMPSPLQCALGIVAMKIMEKEGSFKNLGKEINGKLIKNPDLRNNLWNNLRNNLWNNLGNNL